MGILYTIQHAVIGNTAARLLVVLYNLSAAKKSRQLGYVYASRKALGALLGRSERTAQRCINELKKAGLIRVDRQGLCRNDRIYLLPAATAIVGNQQTTIADAVAFVDRQRQRQQENVASGHDIFDASLNVLRNTKENTSIYPQTTAVPRVTVQQTEQKCLSKGRPTPKRPPNDKKARRRAAEQRYLSILRQRLKLDDAKIWDYDFDGTRQTATETAARILASVLASGRNISVKGEWIQPSKYWDTLQNITPYLLEETLRSIDEVRISTGIRNEQAYLLSALYDRCLYDRLAIG